LKIGFSFGGPSSSSWLLPASPRRIYREYNSAMTAKELLNLLVCPACKKPLTVKDEGATLKCAECYRAYPVRDNIPILLIDQARVEPQ
jgi:uncharacterized protein